MASLSSVVKQHPVGLRQNDLFRWAVSAGWRRVSDHRELNKRLRSLKAACPSLEDVEGTFNTLRDYPEFMTVQKREEIVALLRLLSERRPSLMCEIGTSFGGTLFQLARAADSAAKIISIDCGLSVVRSRVHARMAKKSQRIVCLRSDSTADDTIRRVKAILGDQKLDFLLIDGDHSYTGVVKDFANYSPLVASGGLIALHDILPDYQTKLGIDTENWTGGVPQFWKELKHLYRTEEFLEDVNQDGYGIGLIHW
ncbi:MAG TPA: class I SAM-dependent methyltransferase [Pyrinomonadaceae bacterium]|nr:class I SAM-dependent methyltransferase [Pyrinomonadaceae bacterium]